MLEGASLGSIAIAIAIAIPVPVVVTIPIQLDDLSKQVGNQSCDLLRHLLRNDRSQLGIVTIVVVVRTLVMVMVVTTFFVVLTIAVASAATWRHDL